MARKQTFVWKRARRRLLVAVKEHLDRLIADRDRQTARVAEGKTPLYLALPASAIWTEVNDLKSLINTALAAKA